MSLVDRLQDPPVRLQGTPCSIGALLDRLPEAERDALNAMLSGIGDRRWSQREIHDAITAEGHDVGRQSINRHRAGACRCAKAAS